MHDLRRQALESGKTVSKKAKSRQVSGSNSRTNSKNVSPEGSKVTSRVGSRNASDDEDNFSDETSFSTHSIDEMITSPDEADAYKDTWKGHLHQQIENIVDRKRSSVEGREISLGTFNRILMLRYAQEEVSHKLGELAPALLKSATSGASDTESILALKALALTLITEPSEDLYDMLAGPVKSIVQDSQSPQAKVAALHALGVAAFYGGASPEEVEEIMAFLFEIIESDGASVEAADEADVVTAALEEWGFLATQLEDMEDVSPESIEGLMEQLDSSDAAVQIASGENIALLYEKSFTELEDDEDPSEAYVDSDDSDAGKDAPKMVRRYNVSRQEHLVLQKLKDLAKLSSKRISKRDRRSLHNNFADILNSVEHPTRGPKYRTALDEDGTAYGSQMTVKVGGSGVLRIRTWEQLHRLKALRRVLQGGFLTHYTENQVVFETIPIILDQLEQGRTPKKYKTRRARSNDRMGYENGLSD
ncbi:Interferon-related developmental regulator-like protein [Elsinoe fawcettii]|nr:Interferon-related developmental regulator-like protein [Elsinoe fawcettii]